MSQEGGRADVTCGGSGEFPHPAPLPPPFWPGTFSLWALSRRGEGLEGGNELYEIITIKHLTTLGMFIGVCRCLNIFWFIVRCVQDILPLLS